MKGRALIVITAVIVAVVFGWQLYAMVMWSDPNYRESRETKRSAP